MPPARIGHVVETFDSPKPEAPRIFLSWGPRIYKGPMTYEACEAERKALPESTAEIMLCIKEFAAPGPYGPY